ncbi:Linolenate 9R-lipoxygenase [Frankliniella fusca]|uniref:Linolenate 9R-lipoxygenase n=1 Tax=Frankliniella fusca TaxID=407009 RepID=A0AAE1I2L8_9NEOP|nr:Linolenate 9R-lipoxygenase [Frankliniella fusca]
MAPPGNLHGLSPRHGHAAGPGPARVLDVTEELKREKPWSYLRAAAAAQDEEEDDVFEGLSLSPGKVVRNMYLPPTTRDAAGPNRRASSGSSSGRRRAQQPMEGVFY